MEVRAGYKRTEVGVIPEAWAAPRLDSLGGGSVPPVKAGPFGSSLTKDQYVPLGFKVYGQEQVIRGDHLFGDYFISAGKYRELESCAVRPGDVLLSLVGTAGKLLEVPDDAPLGVINPRLVRFSFDRSRVLPKFFKYQFESGSIQALLSRQAQGGTMGVLNAGALRPFRIPLPPIDEQRAIAAALSAVDALLGGLDRLIAKKRDLKQAAMQQLLTGQTRLPGFRGEWEVKRLEGLCSMKSGEGITAKNIDAVSAYPCYGGNGLRGYTTRFTHYGSYCLIGRVGALCGNLLQVNGQFFASEHAIVVTAFEDVDARWLTLALGTRRLNRRAESSAQPVLTVSKLRPLELIVPTTRAEQTAIAAVLSDMDAELTALEARRDKTRALKQAMMQELLTGRTRLLSVGGAHA